MTQNGFGGSLYAFRYAIVACIVGAAGFAMPLRAQTPAMNDLRGQIFDAKMAQQMFAGGLPHCSELNGTNFYFERRDRVLNLEDYHRSLNSLVLSQTFNPETRRPWSQQDADARWAEVQKLAVTDQANCALVASLPDLQKKLQELQQAAASQSGTAQNNNK